MFDMDGTLLESRRYWFAVVQDASRTFGGPQISWDDYNSTFGQSSADDVAQFFPGTPLDKVDAFYNCALPRHGHHITLMDGVMDVIGALRSRAIPCACVTNSPTAFTVDVLTLLGLRPHFAALACADEVTHPKPAPDLLLLAARRLGVTPENCVMVGDSRFDVMAARAAGIRMVGLHVDADARVSHLSEVLPLL